MNIPVQPPGGGMDPEQFLARLRQIVAEINGSIDHINGSIDRAAETRGMIDKIVRRYLYLTIANAIVFGANALVVGAYVVLRVTGAI